MAEDIILPEVGGKPPQRAQEPVYAVLTSDVHVGSKKFTKDAFRRFILWLRGKYGTPEMREIAGRVKYLLIAGDIVDGVGIYPGQQMELTIRDIHKQYNFAIKYLEKIPSYIEIVLSPGNHDAARKSQPQPAIPRRIPHSNQRQTKHPLSRQPLLPQPTRRRSPDVPRRKPKRHHRRRPRNG